MEYNDKIKAMLESLPTKIQLKEMEVLDSSREADKLEAEVKANENSYEFQIAGEMEEVEKDGELVKKKKFKNDTERSRELEIRLVNNSNYNDNKERLTNLRKEIKDEEIKLSYLKRRFNAGIGLSRLGNE